MAGSHTFQCGRSVYSDIPGPNLHHDVCTLHYYLSISATERSKVSKLPLKHVTSLIQMTFQDDDMMTMNDDAIFLNLLLLL